MHSGRHIWELWAILGRECGSSAFKWHRKSSQRVLARNSREQNTESNAYWLFCDCSWSPSSVPRSWLMFCPHHVKGKWWQTTTALVVVALLWDAWLLRCPTSKPYQRVFFSSGRRLTLRTWIENVSPRWDKFGRERLRTSSASSWACCVVSCTSGSSTLSCPGGSCGGCKRKLVRKRCLRVQHAALKHKIATQIQ